MPEELWCDGEDSYVPVGEVRGGVHYPPNSPSHYVHGGGPVSGGHEQPETVAPELSGDAAVGHDRG
jgi:hypothetical protein